MYGEKGITALIVEAQNEDGADLDVRVEDCRADVDDFSSNPDEWLVEITVMNQKPIYLSKQRAEGLIEAIREILRRYE